MTTTSAARGLPTDLACSACHKGFSWSHPKKSCGRCEAEICSRCVIKTDSRIVGKKNAPKKKVCLSCNALICVPLMNDVMLRCASKTQLLLYLQLKEVPVADNLENAALVRLVEETRASQSDASTVHSFVARPGSERRPMVLPRVEIVRLPSSRHSRSNTASSMSSGRATSGPNTSVNVNVNNLENVLAEQFLRLLLGSGEDSEVLLGGMGGMTDQTEESYQREQAELREKFKADQEKRKAASLLDNAENEEAFSDLRVAELKHMLEANFVDHSDCLEKAELLEKVLRLWKSKRADDDDDKDDATCTICCDNKVDCVFLECGHLTTCTECGSKLTECPMCRKPIKRCLRVFRK
eukprot:m.11719 g.11719  ORF g.11719 m.11719 type:complete len:353 (-) comp8948_c0_seq1:45-1103(-)